MEAWKKSSAGTWNSQFTDRQTTSNLADAERNCEDGCQRLYKTSPVFHKKVRKKKYVLWMCSENICKWGVSFHFLSFWKCVLLHLHGVKKWEFLKPVFRLDKKEEKCSLTQSIAINSCLIHEKIKRCTYACWAHSKQCVKDYMHKEKRQCVLNVSFWINLFLTCTDFFLLTLQEYWLQLWGWRGYGSSYPEYWRCLWSGVARCGLFANSPASAGARRWGSPWVVANGSPAQ